MTDTSAGTTPPAQPTALQAQSAPSPAPDMTSSPVSAAPMTLAGSGTPPAASPPMTQFRTSALGAALVAIGPIAAHLPPLSVILIVVGGVIYSAGVIFHVWERLRFQNAIWHGFVVAAAAAHYGAVLTVFRQMPL